MNLSAFSSVHVEVRFESKHQGRKAGARKLAFLGRHSLMAGFQFFGSNGL